MNRLSKILLGIIIVSKLVSYTLLSKAPDSPPVTWTVVAVSLIGDVALGLYIATNWEHLNTEYRTQVLRSFLPSSTLLTSQDEKPQETTV